MSKSLAFLFDMDGVLVNSEQAWIPHQVNFSTKLFGPKIYKKIGSTIGISIDEIYKRATKYGFQLSTDEYYKAYDKQAKVIYTEATLTEGIEDFIKYLRMKNFKIGLVSSSRRVWIDIVIKKLNMLDAFDLIISLNDRKDLKSKPSPDGYLEAIKTLGAFPSNTLILEDSNPGIASAKASGAFTIGFKEHLLSSYIQIQADSNALNLSEVKSIVDKHLATL